MVGGTSQRDGYGSRRERDVEVADFGPDRGEAPTYSAHQQQLLLKAGQMIVSWAVEVARYEADVDWQWARGPDDDPVMTADALERLIRDTRSVVEWAEALYMAARPDVDR